jgi:hypothetical protein
MRKSRIHLAIGAGLLAALLTSPISWAEDSDRVGTWQLSIPITYIPGTDFDGQGGSTVDLNDDIGFGVGFGYNLNEYFYLGGEITWIFVGYEATVERGDTPPLADFKLSGELDASTFAFKARYNILDKTVTPFLSASLGSTYVDSNIAAGPPQGTCWWHPWWGYICNSWQPTYGDSGFSYRLDAGIRADVSDSFFLEGSYGVFWLNTDGGDNPNLNTFRLELGWRF